MSQVAYALRAEYEDAFAGGVLHVGDRDFDVKAKLDDGGGAIVVDTEQRESTQLVAVLDEYPALKRIAVADAERRAEQSAKQAKTTRRATREEG